MATRVSSAGAPARGGAFDRPVLCAVFAGMDLGFEANGRGAEGVEDSARQLFAAGVDWIQLRDRSLDAAALFAIGCAIVRAAPATGESRLLVNRRVDVALALSAAGVAAAAMRAETPTRIRVGAHLGFDAVTPENARSFLGRGALLGASFHSADEVEAARSAGTIDYAHLAPIWNPRSKPASRPALGPLPLRRAAASGLRILAQGGLDAERASEAIQAGASGIAVTGLLTQAQDPPAAAAALRAALDSATEGMDSAAAPATGPPTAG